METKRRIIRDITHDDMEASVAIIRKAFGTVAHEMGYTETLVPVFPAFVTLEKLKHLKDRGAIFFGMFVGERQVGFVAVEKEPDGKYYMKRLAVLPEYRHGGYGRQLINYAIDYLKSKGKDKVHIAVAGDHGVLNDWYLGMGFRQTSVRQFEHLPFPVSFMEMDIV